MCNCLPSVTRKQHHKALSNGRRCGAAAPAWSPQHLSCLPGGPLPSLPQHTGQAPACRSRGRLLEEIQGAQDAAGMGLSFCSLHPSHYRDLPGLLPGQSGGWGAYPNLSVSRVLINGSPGHPSSPPSQVLCDGLGVQLNLKMGCQQCSAFLGCLISTSVRSPKLVIYSLAKDTLGLRGRTGLWLNDKAPSTGGFWQIPPYLTPLLGGSILLENEFQSPTRHLPHLQTGYGASSVPSSVGRGRRRAAIWRQVHHPHLPRNLMA